jgi:hypothetical protein
VQLASTQMGARVHSRGGLHVAEAIAQHTDGLFDCLNLWAHAVGRNSGVWRPCPNRPCTCCL